jgi:glycosyltransferase involved in cell wall biosynthesis
MGELVKAGGYDVVLNSTARPVKLNGSPLVTMVQNIEPIQTPTYTMPYLWRLRLWALRREHAIACRQATRVLAVSNYVKNEVCRRFQLRQEKVDVVYHGFNPSEVATVRKPDINIPDRDFLFSAGSIVPYRGFEDILRALGEIRSKGVLVPCVVLAGSRSDPARSYEQSLRKLAKTVHITDRIIWAGQLQREEMSWCFNNARLFIQTSRAESFSNIQLEAIGHGCLCVSGNNPPMPEILADAASYYPLGDTCALASEIQNVLKMDKKEDGIRRDRARQRASFFSWDKTAEQTLDALERAIQDFMERKI